MWTEKDVKTWKRADRENVYYVTVPGRTGWISSGKTVKKKAIEWALNEADGRNIAGKTFSEFAQDFFIPGKCPYIKWSGGNPEGVRHWSTMRQILVVHLMPRWGRYMLTSITPRDVFEWLDGIKRVKPKLDENGKQTFPVIGYQLKNKIRYAMKAIMDYAVFSGGMPVNQIMVVPKARRTETTRTGFTQSEMSKMFPENRIQLATIWGGLDRALMYLIAADTGMRPQEITALQWSDYYPALGGFVVKQATDQKRNLKSLKTAGKGVSSKPALVSQRTAQFLEEIRKTNDGSNNSGFIFLASDGRPVRIDTMGKKFLEGLEKAGIERKGRVLYSLRHTFNTAARTVLGDDDKVRDLMGHKTSAMTQNYDHPEDIELLLRVQGQRDGLEKRWRQG